MFADTLSWLSPIDGALLGGAAAGAAAGVLLPRALGVPLSVLVGAGGSLFAIAFLSFPRASDGLELGRFRGLPGGGIQIEFPGARTWDVPAPNGEGSAVCELVVVRLDRRVPAVGGQIRVGLLGVTVDGQVYRPGVPTLLDALLRSRDGGGALLGVALAPRRVVLPPALLETGGRFSLRVGNGALVFSP